MEGAAARIAAGAGSEGRQAAGAAERGGSRAEGAGAGVGAGGGERRPVRVARGPVGVGTGAEAGVCREVDRVAGGAGATAGAEAGTAAVVSGGEAARVGGGVSVSVRNLPCQAESLCVQSLPCRAERVASMQRLPLQSPSNFPFRKPNPPLHPGFLMEARGKRLRRQPPRGRDLLVFWSRRM